MVFYFLSEVAKFLRKHGREIISGFVAIVVAVITTWGVIYRTDNKLNSLHQQASQLADEVGTIIGYADPGLETLEKAGWVRCDGRSLNRADYSNLYDRINTIYGSGDGATTFNIPDYCGMFLRGAEDSGGKEDPDGDRRVNKKSDVTRTNGGVATA